MASYPCCCNVTTCAECDVAGKTIEFVISGTGTFMLGAFNSPGPFSDGDPCVSTYEAEEASCSDFDISVIGDSDGITGHTGWYAVIAEQGIGTQLALIGPFGNCASLFSEAGVLHEDVVVTGCGTHDITITIIP